MISSHPSDGRPSSSSSTSTSQHRKRPSSHSHHRSPSTSLDPTPEVFAQYPIQSIDPSPSTSHPYVPHKRRSISRPWTNEEQEALYVAVERYKLFGRWREVKIRMQLDRSLTEIEEEYNRIYAEIPDSDEESLDEESMSYSYGARQDLPPLTTASSSASLSARSSRETLTGHRPRSHPTSRPGDQVYGYREGRPTHVGHDRFHEEDFEEMGMDMDTHPPKSRLPSGTHPDEQPPRTGGHSRRQTADPTSNEARLPRTVRVWTLKQSEQLKNLIEDCFPGGYRINWIWVASQMGNNFTRKQCKNKWEIMRRRMGTEEEISLLKQGHQEFGPTWSLIQEKYLPERSQGGISIMWELLQAREAEEQQKQQSASPSSSEPLKATAGAINNKP